MNFKLLDYNSKILQIKSRISSILLGGFLREGLAAKQNAKLILSGWIRYIYIIDNQLGPTDEWSTDFFNSFEGEKNNLLILSFQK